MTRSAEKDAPADVVRMIEQRWKAGGEAIPCRCGHSHHARFEYRDGKRTELAPQWGVCDDSACTCRTLRRVLPPGSGDTDA